MRREIRRRVPGVLPYEQPLSPERNPQDGIKLRQMYCGNKEEIHSDINARESWTGNLWEGRYHSFPMDAAYLFNCVRYTERNPVKAGLVKKAEDYPWSSAADHVSGTRKSLLRLTDIREFIDVPDWSLDLQAEDSPELERDQAPRANGTAAWIKGIHRKAQRLAGRSLEPKPAGRKRRMEVLRRPFSQASIQGIGAQSDGFC